MTNSQSTSQHRAEAEKHPPVQVAILTISDTRTPETDSSGRLMAKLLTEAGHAVIHQIILPDEPDQIRETVCELAGRGDIQAVLTNGGTGISPRDGTFEAISGILDKTLPGFGELFRMLSWEEVGAAAMLSRAVAGLHGRTLIFSMPGSSNAVEVAMRRLIIPEIAHLAWEVTRK
ncbi:MAG: MogA/MoaB family molybdenum cofactor biosynthesis protein [Candidatus Sumerlaeia bacterium]|nr:MogA/MoaB family molybdenum cofactor biosynthesis protein [Candidatus Sumerlaeia bacterium]